jgi:hypothetical protein
MSRVNLPIKYRPLDDGGKKSIFLNLLSNLDDDGVTSISSIKDWLKDEELAMQKFRSLNGRQIRNILFSATRLGTGTGSGKLELEDIKKLTDVMEKFAQDISTDMKLQRARNETNVDDYD